MADLTAIARQMIVLVAALAMPIAVSAAKSAPAPGKIARMFADAVRTGNDPKLDGLVPITDAQSMVLANLEGCKPRRMSASTRKRDIQLWSCSKNKDMHHTLTEVFFEDGSVVGIEITPNELIRVVPNG